MIDKWRDKFDNLLNQFFDDYQKLQVVADNAHMIGKIVDIPCGKYKIDDVKYSHSAKGGVVWYLKSVSGDYDNITYAGATLPDEWFKQEKPKWSVGDKVEYKYWGETFIGVIIDIDQSKQTARINFLNDLLVERIVDIPLDELLKSKDKAHHFRFHPGEFVQTIHGGELTICEVLDVCIAGSDDLYTLWVQKPMVYKSSTETRIYNDVRIQRKSDEIIKYNN